MESKVTKFGHSGVYKEYLEGDMYTFEFSNSYGASVICNRMSYGHKEGLWELAVTKDGKLCYSTEITDDVIGWLSETQVEELLDHIEELQEDTNGHHNALQHIPRGHLR